MNQRYAGQDRGGYSENMRLRIVRMNERDAVAPDIPAQVPHNRDLRARVDRPCPDSSCLYPPDPFPRLDKAPDVAFDAFLRQPVCEVDDNALEAADVEGADEMKDAKGFLVHGSWFLVH